MKKFAFGVMVSVASAGWRGGKGAPLSPAAGAAAPGPEAAQGAPPVPATDAEYADIGVPDCDQYARKYLACLERVPEGSRAMVRPSFAQTREHG